MADKWRSRLRTAKAMALLGWARLLVATVPMDRWRHSLGSTEQAHGHDHRLEQAKGLAADIEWAAKRLPFSTQCLPRAMALSWLLRRSGIRHALVFAVRPTGARDTPDALHAWIEVDGTTILGELPGPWLQTLRLGEA